MVSFRDFISSGQAEKPHYMVIGHPIAHSISPLMHTIALRHHDLAADYLGVDVGPADISSCISWFQQESFLGANITLPHKQEFLSAMDYLDDTASEVGAMNTIVKRDGMLTGYNTDVDGFLQPLEPYQDRLEGESVILFGTGGAARAVLHALRRAGVEQLVVVSRNPGGRDYGNDVTLCNYSNWQAYADESAMLVNCTPLGMPPRFDASPVKEPDSHLLAGKICYDLIYNPPQTAFLAMARQEGAVTINGVDMVIGQGDRAFNLWTGRNFPREEVKQTIMEVLDPRGSADY